MEHGFVFILARLFDVCNYSAPQLAGPQEPTGVEERQQSDATTYPTGGLRQLSETLRFPWPRSRSRHRPPRTLRPRTHHVVEPAFRAVMPSIRWSSSPSALASSVRKPARDRKRTG